MNFVIIIQKVSDFVEIESGQKKGARLMEEKKKIWLPIILILAVIIALFVILSVIVTITGSQSVNSEANNAVEEETEEKESTTSESNDTYVSKELEDYTLSSAIDMSVATEAMEETEMSEKLEDADSYLLPTSDVVELTEEDLIDFTAQELTYARNEIYARHGKVFESSELNEYFQGKNWYIADETFADESITDIESVNAQFIVQYQKDNNLEYVPE